MNKASKVLLSALVVTALCFVGVGCCRMHEEPSKAEPPKAEPPKAEHPKAEHPKAEHPKAEHPK